MAHKVKDTEYWYYDIIVCDSGEGLERNRAAMRKHLEAWKFVKRVWRSRITGMIISSRDAEIIVTHFMGQDIKFMVFKRASGEGHKAKQWGCMMVVKGCGLVRGFGKTRREALLRAWGSDK